MTDDLAKRLENVRCDGVEELCWEAADAIEALQAENARLDAEAQAQAQEVDITRRRSDKWQSMVLDCEEYLKEGETPAERIDREIKDCLSMMKMLEKEKRKSEALQAEAHAAAIEAAKEVAERHEGHEGLDQDGNPYVSEEAHIFGAAVAYEIKQEIRALHTDASRAYLAERDERIKREAREEVLREAAKQCERAAYSGEYPQDDAIELGCLRSRDFIRTLHTDASLAAIERIKREAREEALREAASVCEYAAYDGAHPQDDMVELGCLRSRDRILALIEKGGG